MFAFAIPALLPSVGIFMPASTTLPIWKIHDDILRTLRGGNRLVLVAPTGSGKTTQVPQMLLDAGIAGEKMIVVLQPRRVAARTVATRVAWEREGKLGAEVGYQIRFDDHTSVGTRICFVTEGILLRWLQDDPFPRAQVRELAALEADESTPSKLAEAEALVRATLARASEFVELPWPADVELSPEPGERIWQVAGIAPLSSIDQYALLRSTTASELLARLVDDTQGAEIVLTAGWDAGSADGGGGEGTAG